MARTRGLSSIPQPTEPVPTLTAAFVADAVIAGRHKADRYGDPQWAVFRELRNGTGSQFEGTLGDIYAIHFWPSTGHRKVCYEVKVSRSDFLTELKRPSKRRLAVLYSNQFFFAVPKGLVHPDELPPEAGLIEVTDTGTLRTVIDAPMRESFTAPWTLVAAMARYGARAESERDRAQAIYRQISTGELERENERLRLQLEQVTRDRDRLKSTLGIEADRARAYGAVLCHTHQWRVRGPRYEGECLMCLSEKFGK